MSTPTIIRVNKRKHPFVQIDRRVFEDTRMSWKAKGLLGYLLSRPDDWTIIVADLIGRSTDKRDSVYAALKELCEFGYAKHHFTREKGRIAGSVWTIDEEAGVSMFTASGKAVSGKTGNGKTVSGKSATTNKDRSFTDKKKQNDRSPTARTDQTTKHPEPLSEADRLIRNAKKVCDGVYVDSDGNPFEPSEALRSLLDTAHEVGRVTLRAIFPEFSGEMEDKPF